MHVVGIYVALCNSKKKLWTLIYPRNPTEIKCLMVEGEVLAIFGE
jgi:hypothetical protein